MLTNSHIIYGKSEISVGTDASKLSDLEKRLERLESIKHKSFYYSYDSSNFLEDLEGFLRFKSEIFLKNPKLLSQILVIDGIVQDFEFFEVSINLELSATELKVAKKCFPTNHLKQPCKIILVLFFSYT